MQLVECFFFCLLYSSFWIYYSEHWSHTKAEIWDFIKVEIIAFQLYIISTPSCFRCSPIMPRLADVSTGTPCEQEKDFRETAQKFPYLETQRRTFVATVSRTRRTPDLTRNFRGLLFSMINAVWRHEDTTHYTQNGRGEHSLKDEFSKTGYCIIPVYELWLWTITVSAIKLIDVSKGIVLRNEDSPIMCDPRASSAVIPHAWVCSEDDMVPEPLNNWHFEV